MINSKIKIEPRVIQHLGQDLITSPEVAVTELLKNAIDANSPKINIHIFETFASCVNSSKFFCSRCRMNFQVKYLKISKTFRFV